jgi:hypothetical protein
MSDLYDVRLKAIALAGEWAHTAQRDGMNVHPDDILRWTKRIEQFVIDGTFSVPVTA